jgi:hypothetical protein
MNIKTKEFQKLHFVVVDSKGCDFGCFELQGAEIAGPEKEKREQAPVIRTQFRTPLSVAGNKEKSVVFLFLANAAMKSSKVCGQRKSFLNWRKVL